MTTGPLRSVSDRSPDGFSVGVAIFSQADKRAFEIGLRSLAQQDQAVDEVVVFSRQGGARPPYSEEDVIRRVGIGTIRGGLSRDNVRNQALDRLAGHDLVLLMREGTVLERPAIAAERRRFADNPALVAALLTSRRYVPYRLLPPHTMAVEPAQLLARFALTRAVGASRYHAPAMLAVAPKRARLPRFETFAHRSEWAAGRLFLDAAARVGEVAEAGTENVGLIGGAPDRRGGFLQGQECSDALIRLATAHPRYSGLVAADLRRLLLEQSRALLFEPGRTTTRAFIWGMLTRLKAESALKRRLAADIRHLG